MRTINDNILTIISSNIAEGYDLDDNRIPMRYAEIVTRLSVNMAAEFLSILLIYLTSQLLRKSKF